MNPAIVVTVPGLIPPILSSISGIPVTKPTGRNFLLSYSCLESISILMSLALLRLDNEVSLVNSCAISSVIPSLFTLAFNSSNRLAIYLLTLLSIRLKIYTLKSLIPISSATRKSSSTGYSLNILTNKSRLGVSPLTS